MGRLTKDVEAKDKITIMTIAVNSTAKKDDVLFIDVIAFDRQAEACSQYLHKGSSIIVEGRLQERKWEYEGQTKRKIQIVASNVHFLSGKKEDRKGEDTTNEPF